MRSTRIAHSNRSRPFGIHTAVLLALFTLVFAAATTVAHAQTFSVTYNFGSKAGDPFNPTYSGIIAQGRDGNLYSTAYGGANGVGAVLKITPDGTSTVVYSFTGGDDGGNPVAGLTLGADGNFYGTAATGGINRNGTIFKITPGGSLTPLYSFTGGADGGTPYAPPIQGTDGNFYGTTTTGGDSFCGNCGTVYKITTSGKFTLLYLFEFTTGIQPFAPLIQGTDGNFYGTTVAGGNPGGGVVFKITATGKLTVLYNFDSVHGAAPFGPLVQGSDANFYGTAASGGTNNGGVVFKLTPAGQLTVLHNMNPDTDGTSPFAGLVQATDGNFYGANAFSNSGQGTLFKITPQGTFSVLHTFDGTTGSTPWVTPFQNTNGIVYGDTQSGGTGDVLPCTSGQCGVFYSWNAGLKPFVSLLPARGKVGATVEILGQGFTGTTKVSFNGTSATFKVISDTYLTTTVPAGATTGFLSVTTPGGTLKSNRKFLVVPTILNFDPTSGPVGTSVIITGNSFKQTQGVGFGDTIPAQFTVDSDTQITAIVPQGAKTGPVGVKTPGGTAISKDKFTVTP